MVLNQSEKDKIFLFESNFLKKRSCNTDVSLNPYLHLTLKFLGFSFLFTCMTLLTVLC